MSFVNFTGSRSKNVFIQMSQFQLIQEQQKLEGLLSKGQGALSNKIQKNIESDLRNIRAVWESRFNLNIHNLGGAARSYSEVAKLKPSEQTSKTVHRQRVWKKKKDTNPLLLRRTAVNPFVVKNQNPVDQRIKELTGVDPSANPEAFRRPPLERATAIKLNSSDGTSRKHIEDYE